MSEIAAKIYAYGQADDLRIEPLDLPPPAAGEVRLRHSAIGVNYVDIYHRTGLYPLKSLPATLGVEGAGVIEALGPGVYGLTIGQRVAYAGEVGSYATQRNLAADRVILLPESVADDLAAAVMLKGITAHMLLTHVRKVQPGETVLIHAAAGGLGLVLVQWAKSLGAQVIGTVGSAAKAALAKSYGLDHTILHHEEDFVAATMALTDGQGVHFAIDGIGGTTLPRTLATVRPYGMVASIGQVAGPIGSIAPEWLGPARSIALSRPGVFCFMRDLVRYREGAEATLRQLQAGLRTHIDTRMPLQEAAMAHRRLESGKSLGALLLQP